MGLFSNCGRTLLIILNVLFILVALILFIVGIILKFFPGVLFQFLLDGIKGVTDFDVPRDFNQIHNVPLLKDLGLAIFILALFLFVVAFLACCGACYKFKPLLACFCVCVVLLILAIGLVGGLFLNPSSPVHSTFKTDLSKEVFNDYKGPRDPDIFSLVINIMSYSMNCCGMNGTGDFNTSAPWTNYKVDDTHTIHIDVTPACCNHTVLKKGDLTCAQKSNGKFNTEKTNTEGCYDQILNLVENNKIYAIIIIVVLILILLLELLFAILLMRSDKEYDV